MIIDGDGNGTGGAGKIAADHEDDAKFSEGVSESENDGGDYTGKRERKNDGAESAEFVCAEDARSVEKFWIESFE